MCGVDRKDIRWRGPGRDKGSKEGEYTVGEAEEYGAPLADCGKAKLEGKRPATSCARMRMSAATKYEEIERVKQARARVRV